jgi:hypothetical protein
MKRDDVERAWWILAFCCSLATPATRSNTAPTQDLSYGIPGAPKALHFRAHNLLIIGYAVAHSERCGKTLVLYSLQCSLIIKCKLRLLCAEAVRIGRITTILPN